MTVDLLDIGYDSDEDAAPPSHCPGPSYDGAGWLWEVPNGWHVDMPALQGDVRSGRA